MRRYIPSSPGGEPLTFEEIAAKSTGDRLLAILKADVDDMGVKVGQIAGQDSPEGRHYEQLQSFSRSLHSFFVDRVQDMLKDSWPLIYTIYAGGDDLLLVGPWNVMLDFAGALDREFESGPGREYGPLTLSAGVALTPYHVPVRHSVGRGEELLEQAKGRKGKNSCAALGSRMALGQPQRGSERRQETGRLGQQGLGVPLAAAQVVASGRGR